MLRPLTMSCEPWDVLERTVLKEVCSVHWFSLKGALFPLAIGCESWDVLERAVLEYVCDVHCFSLQEVKCSFLWPRATRLGMSWSGQCWSMCAVSSEVLFPLATSCEPWDVLGRAVLEYVCAR